MKSENLTWREYLIDYYAQGEIQKEYQLANFEAEELRQKFVRLMALRKKYINKAVAIISKLK